MVKRQRILYMIPVRLLWTLFIAVDSLVKCLLCSESAGSNWSHFWVEWMAKW